MSMRETMSPDIAEGHPNGMKTAPGMISEGRFIR